MELLHKTATSVHTVNYMEKHTHRHCSDIFVSSIRKSRMEQTNEQEEFKRVHIYNKQSVEQLKVNV